MRIGITGEKGFIATNLLNEIIKQGHEFVSLDNSDYAKNFMEYTKSGEVCVHKNCVESVCARGVASVSRRYTSRSRRP